MASMSNLLELQIQVGQYWRTRNGTCMRVDAKVPGGWLCYMAYNQVVDERGLVVGGLVPHGLDLMWEVKDEFVNV